MENLSVTQIFIVTVLVLIAVFFMVLVPVLIIWGITRRKNNRQSPPPMEKHKEPERPKPLEQIRWKPVAKITVVNNKTDKEHVYEAADKYGIGWRWSSDEKDDVCQLLIRRYLSYNVNDTRLIAVLDDFSILNCVDSEVIVINQSEIDARNKEIEEWDEKNNCNNRVVAEK